MDKTNEIERIFRYAAMQLHYKKMKEQYPDLTEKDFKQFIEWCLDMQDKGAI